MELVRLIHQIDERECVQRNALANTPTGFELSAGAVGTVVDTFGNGAEFLVEFGHRGPYHCDWLGVLKASELEFLPGTARAA
jgi:hypothetical protein